MRSVRSFGWMRRHKNGGKNNNYKIDNSNKSIIFCGDTFYGGCWRMRFISTVRPANCCRFLWNWSCGPQIMYGENAFCVCVSLTVCSCDMVPFGLASQRRNAWRVLLHMCRRRRRRSRRHRCRHCRRANQSQLKCMTSSSIGINGHRYVIP